MALKERIGTVVSDKMDKTVVVAVINRFSIKQVRLRRLKNDSTRNLFNSC